MAFILLNRKEKVEVLYYLVTFAIIQHSAISESYIFEVVIGFDLLFNLMTHIKVKKI